MNVCDENYDKVYTDVTINIGVEIGNQNEMAKFNTVEWIATNILLKCEYYDKKAEEIKHRQRIVKLDEGKITW